MLDVYRLFCYDSGMLRMDNGQYRTVESIAFNTTGSDSRKGQTASLSGSSSP